LRTGGAASTWRRQPYSTGPTRTSQVATYARLRKVRRDLVVHAAVEGATDTRLLVYMSIVKDAARIGDYARDIHDLSALGVNFSDAPDREEMVEYRDRISAMISDAAGILATDDVDAANVALAAADVMLDEFDEKVAALCAGDRPEERAVPRALLYRHFKRVVAHLMNLLSAVVMPVDSLDYYDGPRRGSS
jgi:phosphate transport system protein